MNLNVYIEDSLAKKLKEFTKKTGKARNTIIREALREWIEHHQIKQWPKSILSFKGFPEVPPFECNRDELSPPSEDPFK